MALVPSSRCRAGQGRDEEGLHQGVGARRGDEPGQRQAQRLAGLVRGLHPASAVRRRVREARQDPRQHVGQRLALPRRELAEDLVVEGARVVDAPAGGRAAGRGQVDPGRAAVARAAPPLHQAVALEAVDHAAHAGGLHPLDARQRGLGEAVELQQAHEDAHALRPGGRLAPQADVRLGAHQASRDGEPPGEAVLQPRVHRRRHRSTLGRRQNVRKLMIVLQAHRRGRHGHVAEAEQLPGRHRAEEGEVGVVERGELRLDARQLSHGRSAAVAGDDQVRGNARAAAGALALHAHDPVAVADEGDDGLPVGHRHVLGEGGHDDPVVNGDADRDPVGPRPHIAPRPPQALQHPELLEGVEALVAQHEPAGAVHAGGRPLQHHGVVAPGAQEAGEGELDHPAADDDGADHPGRCRPPSATHDARRLDAPTGSRV